MLEWGYEVAQASNGVEALEQIERMRPDLVLLDIQMPLLDGFGVIARIRSDPRSAALPVVAISAYAMRDDSRRICSAGFDAYVAKPLDLEALRVLLQETFRTCWEPSLKDSTSNSSEEPAQ